MGPLRSYGDCRRGRVCAECLASKSDLNPLLRICSPNTLSSLGRRGLQLRVAVRDGDVLLTVPDDGPGIAAADLAHVVERFFTTRRHNKGTGLGLSIVRAVVEAHGGTAHVDSAPGRGATFSVTCPRPADYDSETRHW